MFIAILIVVLLWMVICESSMLAEVATDKAQLPYISRWLICFMGWLSECIVCFKLALFFVLKSAANGNRIGIR